MVKEHGWRSGESTVLHHGGIGRAVSTTLQCCSTKSCNYVIVTESTFLGLWAVGVFRSVFQRSFGTTGFSMNF